MQNKFMLIMILIFAGTIVGRASTLNIPGDFATITQALDAATTGDLLLITPGTYEETGMLQVGTPGLTLKANGGAVVVHVPASVEAVMEVAGQVTGVQVQGITFERTTASNDWMRAVQLHGDSATSFSQCIFRGPAQGVGAILFNGADAAFDGCTFGNFKSSANWAGAISMEAGGGSTYSNLTIDQCIFDTGCNKWIAHVGPTGNEPMVGNVIVRNTQFDEPLQSQAIYFRYDTKYDPSAQILFEDCTFQGSYLETAEFHYTSQGGPRSFTMRRCDFKAYDSFRKIMWYDLPTTTVLENVLFEGGKHETLLRVWGGPPSLTLNHCTLINDGITADESESGLNSSTLIDGWDGGRTFVIRNSLLYSPTNYSAALVGDAGSTANRIYDIDYSIVQHATAAGAYVAIVGGAHYSNANIGFVDAAGRDYHLATGSPAIDGGVNLGIALDLAGNVRSQGLAPDMGVYETVSSLINASKYWSVY